MSNRPKADRNMYNCKIWWGNILPKEMQGGYQTQSTFLLSRGKCTYRECCHLLLLSVQEARWHGHGRGKADSSGSGQNEQWAREIYFYQLQQYFFFFFSISEMFTHGVSPWALRVRGWRCVGVLFFFPIEVFLRAGGSHPACTRLKAKKLCSERC